MIADAQYEHYSGEIKKQQKKSDTASSEMRAIRDGTSTGTREYNQVRRDYYRSEANKGSLKTDRTSFDRAFRE